MRDRVPPEQPDQLPAYLRQSEEEQEQRFRDLSRRAPKTAELSMVSRGPGEEIQAPHGLRKPPTRWREICPSSGSYRIWQQGDSFSDPENVYLVTDAPAGTRFMVEVWIKEN